MKCKFSYDGKCNLTGVACWYLMAEVDAKELCLHYEEDNYRSNPEHERI